MRDKNTNKDMRATVVQNTRKVGGEAEPVSVDSSDKPPDVMVG